MTSAYAPRTIALVGLGGIGCPALMALVASPLHGRLRLLDDDVVDVLNLHRQIAFGPQDVGRPKVEAAARWGRAGLTLEPRRQRALPETVAELLEGVDVVLDGSDNYATKFLLSDAARLAGIPCVTAGAVEWRGTVFAASARGACYRCLFEDLPDQPGPACADVGVMGPVVGMVGALAADAALRLDASAESWVDVVQADGSLRRHEVRARRDCPSCGDAPRIRDVRRERYLAPFVERSS